MHDRESSTQDSGAVSTRRRAFLAAAGSIGVTALAGCLSPTGASSGGVPPAGSTNNSTNATSGNFRAIDPKQWRGEFQNVVNMAKAGADPTGEEDVSPVIQREIGSDTLLYFPSGRYKMNSQVRRVGLRNIGIIGQNATLTHGRVDEIKGFDVSMGEFHGPAQHFKIGIPDDPHRGKFVFGGFTLDWRGKNQGMQVLNHHTAGTSEIRSLRQVGLHSLGCQGPLRVNPATEEARARVHNVDFRFGGLTYQKTINTRDTYDGGPYAGRSWATSGITMHPTTQGYLRVENSLFGGWPDNGIYVIGGHPGTGDGTVEVVNCVAANSQASNIRIGGDNSRIHNCVVVTDHSFGDEFYSEQRPIRVDDGTCTVSNTKIVQKKPTGWSLTVMHAVEEAVVKNVKVTIKNTPMTALVVDDGVGQATVDDFVINTPGWDATKAQVIRNGGATLKNVFLDGEQIA
ncbi:hypothetical protein SAMN05421858_4726 [Haladaptatus litoreus]|uniref:Pectate lyase superfamily protein n=1 Tax=Haladaptatus litoreus TaxID=553468 RepID=A0A1N7F1Y1_9EURY|nr:hypothetical protein [Haladaptatus litoreus]SIR94316.1 hypothetical protein SAMN05421858_4726 [Haladaptatus litoreus]